jgi:hypothetical protein
MSDQITTSRFESLAFRTVPIDRRNFGMNSEGESISRPLRGCEMRGNLAELMRLKS